GFKSSTGGNVNLRERGRSTGGVIGERRVSDSGALTTGRVGRASAAALAADRTGAGRGVKSRAGCDAGLMLTTVRAGFRFFLQFRIRCKILGWGKPVSGFMRVRTLASERGVEPRMPRIKAPTSHDRSRSV
ncbi:MAG: hypothetical protein ABSC60_04670, partial [Acidobacteriota bacterium]